MKLNFLSVVVFQMLAVFTATQAVGEQDTKVIQMLIAMLGSFIVAIAVLRAYFRDNMDDDEAWVLIVVSLVAMVLVSSVFHSLAGVCLSSEKVCSPTVGNWDVGVYFSVVTFTTLGYGDYLPQPGLRHVATATAVIGYIYLGFVVAAATHWAKKK